MKKKKGWGTIYHHYDLGERMHSLTPKKTENTASKLKRHEFMFFKEVTHFCLLLDRLWSQWVEECRIWALPQQCTGSNTHSTTC